MYREFWHLLFKEAGRGPTVIAIGGVTILVAMLEGLNIGLLIPLLETFDSSNSGEVHWVTRVMRGVFEDLGIPFGLGQILLVLGGIMLLVAVLKYIRTVMAARARENVVVWLRSRNVSRLLNADISYYHHRQIGVLSDTLTTQANQIGTGLYLIVEILSSVGIAASYFIAAFLIAPLLTLIALVMLLIVSISMQVFISRAKAIAIIRFARETELQAASIENLSAIHVVKSFLLESLRTVEFNRRAESLAETGIQLNLVRGQMVIIQELALFGLIGGIIFVGVSVLDMRIPVIVALLFTLYRLAPRITGLNASRQGLATTVAGLHSLKLIMDETDSPKIVSGKSPYSGLQERVELRDVSFSYNGSGDVLNHTSFTIEKNKMTAIVGASGAGKSTIVDLLLRYYDPSEGSILVDGVDLRQVDLSSWRRSIGMVSQDIFLFNDTVANNISLWRVETTREEVEEAARQSYAHEFILQLPEGYNTNIGDRGWNLSGGQRQRIALARAILNKPAMLVLDEATSSLDSESERLIHEYINQIRGSATMLVVAHRMSTIHDADKIVVLEDGKIVEQGDLDSLLAASGSFANYHRLQYEN